MIKIIDTKQIKQGKTKYRVVVNNKLICEFWQNRLEGLGMCLLEASKTVEKGKYLKIREQLDDI